MKNLKVFFLAVTLLSTFDAWALTNEQMEELADLYMRANSQGKIAMLNKLTPVEAANVLVLVDVKHQKVELYLEEQLRLCNR